MAAATIDSKINIKTVTIAAGATGLSAVVDLEGFDSIAVETDAAFVTAVLTFQAAPYRDGTFKNVYDNTGTEVVTASITASTIHSLDTIFLALRPFRFIKIRSGTAASAVDQTSGTTLTLHLKG